MKIKVANAGLTKKGPPSVRFGAISYERRSLGDLAPNNFLGFCLMAGPFDEDDCRTLAPQAPSRPLPVSVGGHDLRLQYHSRLCSSRFTLPEPFRTVISTRDLRK